MPITAIPVNDRVQRYIAAAGQTAFTYDFPIYSAAHIRVTRLRAGVETVLVLAADYTVIGVDSDAGGTVTLLAASLANDVLLLESAMPVARVARFTNGGPLPAASLEYELNALVVFLQQILTAGTKSVLLAATDTSLQLPPAPTRANKVLGFGPAGDSFEVFQLQVGGSPVTPFAATLLDDSSAAEARATLQVLALAGGTLTGALNLIAPAADAHAARRRDISFEYLRTSPVMAGNPTFIEFPLDAGYSSFQFSFFGIAPSAATFLAAQISNDAGATWLGAGTSYSWGQQGVGSTGAAADVASASNLFPCSFTQQAGSIIALNGTYQISMPDTASHHEMRSDFFGADNANWAGGYNFGATSASFNRANRLRMFFSSSTFQNRGRIIQRGIRA